MIHIVSKEYYLKNRCQGEMEKIVIESQFFPIRHKFFMKDGFCFIYLMELGFLVVPKDSGFTKDILNEPISRSEWFMEKYDKPLNLTKNYINSFPNVTIYENFNSEWINEYCGYVRIWNTLTNEEYIFYKQPIKNCGKIVYGCTTNSPKSYICKLAIGDEVKFPIDLTYANEFNMYIKNIIEWI